MRLVFTDSDLVLANVSTIRARNSMFAVSPDGTSVAVELEEYLYYGRKSSGDERQVKGSAQQAGVAEGYGQKTGKNVLLYPLVMSDKGDYYDMNRQQAFAARLSPEEYPIMHGGNEIEVVGLTESGKYVVAFRYRSPSIDDDTADIKTLGIVNYDGGSGQYSITYIKLRDGVYEVFASSDGVGTIHSEGENTIYITNHQIKTLENLAPWTVYQVDGERISRVEGMPIFDGPQEAYDKKLRPPLELAPGDQGVLV